MIEEQLWVEPGAHVNAFTAANHAFGSVFLRFENREELEAFRSNTDQYMRVCVERP